MADNVVYPELHLTDVDDVVYPGILLTDDVVYPGYF